MKISLMKKLSLVIIMAILGSILITSFISNHTVSNQFKAYLIDEHKSKENDAIKIIKDLYNDQNGFSNVSKDEIQRYAELQNLFIEVRDTNSNTLYSSGNDYLQSNNMMGNNMMHSMMGNFSGMNLGDYTENKYPLSIDNKKVGTITIGYFGTSYLSAGSMTFMRTLNMSFVLSAVIALIFGLLVSIIISRQLSKPIVNITKTANIMRAGNLNVKASVNTNTEEIAELANSMNYLAETLNNQEMLRKRMTSDIAHELRTPLTTLKTHVEAFIDGVFDPTPERLEAFYEEIERLTKLVDNLRNLAKQEQDTLTLYKTEVDLSLELEKIIDSFKPLYIKENYEILSKVTPNIKANIDKDKFKQIMTNLLSNSYRYLNKEGKVTVSLKEKEDNIVIKVIDTGIGIPEKDLPFIFERFYRSDLSRNSNTGGSGIGLTITKAFVEAHGGKILVESKVDKGTTFSIYLPKV